jgi:uncharacterized protein YegJ (DUF2314 family)
VSKTAMKESPHNIELHCPKHSRKPDKRWADKLPDFFVGKFVKKKFDGIQPDGQIGGEHMWVKITRTDGVALFGPLDNDPVLAMELKCGDDVRVLREDIEQVLDGRTELFP